MHKLLCLLIFIASCAGAPSHASQSVWIEELTWVEVRDAIRAGKTTLIFPTGGTEQNGPHMVLGKHNYIVKHNAEEIAKRLGNALVAPVLAYVPEGRGVIPNLTVRENLLMAARAPQMDGWTLERVLATFPRLTERLHQPAGLLSGGEQQMLAIGRALLTQPQLMLLDEATEGLAPLVVAEIWRVIDEIRKDGIACLIVDRNYRRVLAHVNRAVVLQKGEIVLEGDAAVLCADARLTAFLGV